MKDDFPSLYDCFVIIHILISICRKGTLLYILKLIQNDKYKYKMNINKYRINK